MKMYSWRKFWVQPFKATPGGPLWIERCRSAEEYPPWRTGVGVIIASPILRSGLALGVWTTDNLETDDEGSWIYLRPAGWENLHEEMAEWSRSDSRAREGKSQG